MCNAKGWIFPEQVLTLCLAALGERKWQGKQRQREGGGKEKGIASLFVCLDIEKKGEKKVLFTGLVCWKNKIKSLSYILIWLICLYVRNFWNEVQGYKGHGGISKVQDSLFPSFSAQFAWTKKCGPRWNLHLPTSSLFPFPPKTIYWNVFTFFPLHFYFPLIPMKSNDVYLQLQSLRSSPPHPTQPPPPGLFPCVTVLLAISYIMARNLVLFQTCLVIQMVSTTAVH